MTALVMSEADLQKCVTDLATLRGWLWFHDQRSDRNPAGLPDLILVRGGRLLFVENKSEKGRLGIEQQDWLHRLGEVQKATGGCEVYVWRPSDWLDGTIRKVLM